MGLSIGTFTAVFCIILFPCSSSTDDRPSDRKKRKQWQLWILRTFSNPQKERTLTLIKKKKRGLIERGSGGGSVVQDATSRRSGWATMATRNYWQQQLSILFTGVFRNTTVQISCSFIYIPFSSFFHLTEKRASTNSENVIRGEREIVWPDNCCIPWAQKQVSILGAKLNQVASFQKEKLHHISTNVNL